MALKIQRLVNGDAELIGRVIDGRVSDGRLYGIFPPQVWYNRSDEYLSSRLNGPTVFAAKLTEDEIEPIDDPADYGDWIESQNDSQQDRSETDPEVINMSDNREWVSFTGPDGMEGWRSTITQKRRYQDVRPADSALPETITLADVESAQIRHATAYKRIDGFESVSGGDAVSYYEPDTERVYDDSEVVETGPSEVTLRESRSGDEVTVTTDDDGSMHGTVRLIVPVQIGFGVAGSDEPLIDDGSPVSDAQLYAEAIRALTAGETPTDTEPLERLVGLVSDAVSPSQLHAAVRVALDEHPELDRTDAEQVEDSGQHMFGDIDMGTYRSQTAGPTYDDETVTAVVRSLTQQDRSLSESPRTHALSGREGETASGERKRSQAAKGERVIVKSRSRKDTEGGNDWIPYVGPQQGTGWQTSDGEEVTYDDEPPGETPPGAEELVNATGEEIGIAIQDAVPAGARDELAERVDSYDELVNTAFRSEYGQDILDQFSGVADLEEYADIDTDDYKMSIADPTFVDKQGLADSNYGFGTPIDEGLGIEAAKSFTNIDGLAEQSFAKSLTQSDLAADEIEELLLNMDGHYNDEWTQIDPPQEGDTIPIQAIMGLEPGAVFSTGGLSKEVVDIRVDDDGRRVLETAYAGGVTQNSTVDTIPRLKTMLTAADQEQVEVISNPDPSEQDPAGQDADVSVEEVPDESQPDIDIEETPDDEDEDEAEAGATETPQEIDAELTEIFSDYEGEFAVSVALEEAVASDVDATELADMMLEEGDNITKYDIKSGIQLYFEEGNAQLETAIGDFDPTDTYRNATDLEKFSKQFLESNPGVGENIRMPPSNDLYDTKLTAAYSEWSGSSSDPRSALIWEAASQMQDYENVPFDKVNENRETFSDPEIEAAQEMIEFQQEALRDAFGDELTVYRGNDGNTSQRFYDDAAGSGEASEFEHMTCSSWSLMESVAKKFGGVTGQIYATEIPVEKVMGSMLTGAGLGDEFEVVVCAEEQEYEPAASGEDFDDGNVVNADSVTLEQALAADIERIREIN